MGNDGLVFRWGNPPSRRPYEGVLEDKRPFIPKNTDVKPPKISKTRPLLRVKPSDISKFSPLLRAKAPEISKFDPLLREKEG